MQLRPRLINPVLERNRQASRRDVEAWICQIIEGDAARGRSQHDFTTKGMAEVVKEIAPVMQQQGFDTYQGGGNIFYVTYREATPLVIHARPLAQRTVRLKFA